MFGAGRGFAEIPGGPLLMIRGDVERAAFAALPDDVEIRFTSIPTRVEQDDDGVEVTITDTKHGSTSTDAPACTRPHLPSPQPTHAV